jgi:hypothetical protein
MMSALENLQAVAVKLITAQPYFTPVPVLYERQKNVANEIAKAVNTLKGIAILVTTPFGKNTQPGAPDVHLSVQLAIDVVENVIINTSANGTQLGCNEVAEQICAHLHYQVWMPGKTLICKDVAEVPSETLVIHRVTFETGCLLAKL